MEDAAAPLASGYSSLNSETESSLSSSPRLNEFGGPESSWRVLTERDRAVFDSIARIQDQDLSIHLYNAHAMKSRRYDIKAYSKLDPWAGKDRWHVVGNKENRSEQSEFVPPKTWTAWPLDPASVPRSEERVGEVCGDDAYTFKKPNPAGPTNELMELMIAVTLRFAKEIFESRKWDDSSHQETQQLEEKKMRAMAAQQDHAGAELHELQEIEISAQYGSDQESHKSRTAQLTATITDSVADSFEHEPGIGESRRPKRLSEPLPKKVNAFQRPVISADDERSRLLLLPSLRHNISQLDKLLLALHHARRTCLRNNSEDSSSEENSIGKGEDEFEGPKSEANAAGNEKSPMKRPVGRPRKTFDFSKIRAQSSSQVESNSDMQPTKSRRGRKRQVYQLLEGESREEMLVRIARKQKKPLPFLSNSPPTQKSESDKKSSSKEEKGSRVSESKQRMRLGVRDWSEILGTAALVGFSPDVVLRAAQRCATLFGEGIILRSLVENPIPGTDEDEVLCYEPEEIPYLDEGESSADSSAKGSISNVRLSGQGLYLCPCSGCLRFQRGFKRRSNLRRHLKLTHKLNMEEFNRTMTNSEDEMDGAVHADGFMKRVKRRAWREADKSISSNRGRNRSRRQQKPESGSQESDESSGVGFSDDRSVISKEQVESVADETKQTAVTLENASGKEED